MTEPIKFSPVREGAKVIIRQGVSGNLELIVNGYDIAGTVKAYRLEHNADSLGRPVLWLALVSQEIEIEESNVSIKELDTVLSDQLTAEQIGLIDELGGCNSD